MRTEVGAGLRAQRQKLGLSLRTVAAAAGISPSMLSQVENGKLNPSLATLYEIALYLNISVDGLLGLKPDEDQQAGAEASLLRSSVQRSENNPILELASGVRWERLAHRSDSPFESTLVYYPPGSSSSFENKLAQHTGFEFGYVIRNELTMYLGHQHTVLRPGDSFCIEAEIPHRFHNETDTETKVIWFDTVSSGALKDTSTNTDRPNQGGAAPPEDVVRALEASA